MKTYKQFINEISAGLAGRVMVKARRLGDEASTVGKTNLDKMWRARTEKGKEAAWEKSKKAYTQAKRKNSAYELAKKKLLGGDTSVYRAEYDKDSILRGPNWRNIPKARVPATESADLDESYPTKKHFIQVAKIISQIADPKARQQMANDRGAEFAAQNPRFDHARWHAACGTQHKPTKPPHLRNT